MQRSDLDFGVIGTNLDDQKEGWDVCCIYCMAG